jgi:hypothetical protein
MSCCQGHTLFVWGSFFFRDVNDTRENPQAIARVGAESTLLPNGDVFVNGGAQMGCMGGQEQGVNRAVRFEHLRWIPMWQPELQAVGSFCTSIIQLHGLNPCPRLTELPSPASSTVPA